MATFERETPSDDHRLIKVNGLNLPEFMHDTDIYDPYNFTAVTAFADWIDHALAANKILSDIDNSWQTPASLWVPKAIDGALRLASGRTITTGQEIESLSYLDDTSQTVNTTSSITRRAISSVPKRLAPQLDDLILHEDIEVNGYFRYDPGLNRTTLKIGNLLVWGGEYRRHDFFNEVTGKHPNASAAQKMAQRAGENILSRLGYKPEAFTDQGQTYGEYIATLSK